MTIYQGDCLECMQNMQDGSVDMVLTDPPYSSGGMYRSDRAKSTRTKYCDMTVQQQGGKISVESTGNASRDGTAAVNEQKYTNLDGKILEIKTSVDGLSVKAANLQNDYTQLTQTVNGLELTVVKDGEVRTAFAADDTSVLISSGVISFTSNSITIDSSDFKLGESGNVTATGTFSTNNGIVGNGRNEATLSSGGLTLYRTNSAGAQNEVAQLYGTGENASLGGFALFGPDASGDSISQFYITTSFTGSRLSMQDASGTATVVFNASSGNGVVKGNFDVQGSTGLGVTTTVSCQNLNAWGSKNRIVPTSVGNVKMAAFETPEPCFADSGSAQLDEKGLCVLELDPVYAETIEPVKSLRWLVTPTSDGAAWVEKRGACAMVHGTPGLTFDWMCVGAQKGYGDVYAERCYDAQPTATPDAENDLDFIDWLDSRNRMELDSLLDGYDWESFTNALLAQKG